MTLELNRVLAQLDAMGRELIRREKGHARVAEQAALVLARISDDYVQLRDLATRARDQQGWQAAIPLGEPLRQAMQPPPLPDYTTIIATDGSQIEPDSHGIALYYLINIGSIIFRHNTGQRPVVASEPTLYYAADDLYENRHQVQGDLLAFKRDIAELRRLADLAEQEDAARLVALSDGPLLHWFSTEGFSRSAERLRQYFAQLDRLKAAGAALAGYISRPRYTAVTTLLYLARLGENFPQHNAANSPFVAITDRHLFHFLAPGQRSALFVSPRPTNTDYQAAGHEICFFYLHTGIEICRVEMPRWALTHIDLIHAILYDQCKLVGTPYVLLRAHELAVITGADRNVLEQRIAATLARYGLRATASAKARAKELLRDSRYPYGYKYRRR